MVYLQKNLKSNIKKIPGRQIVKDLYLSDKIKRVLILGNCSDVSLEYLKKRYNNKIIEVKNLPYGRIEFIARSLNLKLDNQTLVYITLPTPKQEQLAYYIARQNTNYKIICIGASIMIASGEEKEVPKIFENFEFLWRLRTEIH